MKKELYIGLAALVLATGCATGKPKLDLFGYRVSTGNSVKIEKVHYGLQPYQPECEHGNELECIRQSGLVNVVYEF